MGLLQRSPPARLGGEGLLERLGGSPAAPAQALRSFRQPSLFVGRSAELTILLDAFAETRAGQTRLLHLHGGSGTGKTQLLRHFMEQVRRSEPTAVILQGRCYAQESVPFKALDPLVDDLSRYLMRLPPEKVEALAPRNVQALTRLFPVLSRVFPFRLSPRQSAETEDAKSVLRRASLALRELLGRIGEIHPVLIVIDDLQWGDYDSSRLLRDLLSPPDAPVLMLVACYRTEEDPQRSRPGGTARSPDRRPGFGDRPARAGPPRRGEPGAVPDRAGRVERLSAGGAHRQGCRRQPFLHRRAGASSPPALPGNAGGGGGGQSLCLHPPASGGPPGGDPRIVEVLAIAGYPLSWTMVKAALQAEEDCIPPLSLFKAGRLLRVRNAPTQTLEIYHDFVRRAVLSALSGAHRRGVDPLLAETMEAAGCPEPETLAQHYLQADEIEKAAEWLAMAADRAAAGLAFKNAAELYRRSIFCAGLRIH